MMGISQKSGWINKMEKIVDWKQEVEYREIHHVLGMGTSMLMTCLRMVNPFLLAG